MALAKAISNSFNSGELSPFVKGRTDQARYFNGLDACENWIPLISGGAQVRPGTIYAGRAKATSTQVRLIPFVFSASQSFILEFGNNYIRFWKFDGTTGLPVRVTKTVSVSGAANNGAGLIRITTSAAHLASTGWTVTITGIVGTTEANATWVVTVIDSTHFDLQGSTFANAYVSGGSVVEIVEVTTTYTTAQIPYLQYAQSADIVFLAHTAHAPAELSRLVSDATSWSLLDTVFNPPPIAEGKTDLLTTMYSSAATGNGVTLTSGAVDGSKYFYRGDQGRLIKTVNGAIAVIRVPVDGTNQTTADILQGSFNVVAAPYASGEWWMTGSPTSLIQVGLPVVVGAAAIITARDSPGGAARNTWRTGSTTGDLNKYINFVGGTVQITSVDTSTQVTGRVISILANGGTTPDYNVGGDWMLGKPVWNATDGYPTAVTIHQQRLTFAGAGAEPDTVRMSETGDYRNFTPGTVDSRALDFQLATGTVTPIDWMEPSQNLVVGTLSREFYVGDRTGLPLTPTKITSSPQSAVGCSFITPIVAGDALLFIQRGQRKVIEFIYNLSSDSGFGNDLTKYADHLTIDVTTDGDRAFIANAFQSQPTPIAWYVRADGTLCGLTYDRGEKVLAWHRQTTWRGATQDQFESVAVIQNPVTFKDQAWMCVIRGSNRNIEVFDAFPNPYRKSDASIKYSGGATATVTGLSHLEGETVYIRGKSGAGVWNLYPTQVVASGQVTGLSPTVVEAEVGLAFPATATTLRLEIPGVSTLVGRRKAFGLMQVRSYNTPSLKIQGVRYPLGWYNSAAASAIPTGSAIAQQGGPLSPATAELDFELGNIGVDTDGKVTFSQDLPLGGTLLVFTAEVDVGH